MVNGARKIHIVQYVMDLKLRPLVENRESIFEKCYPVSSHLAHKMLAFTYKHMSSFGYWDPVKVTSEKSSGSHHPLTFLTLLRKVWSF